MEVAPRIEVPLVAPVQPQPAIQNRPAVSVVDHSGLEDVAMARGENPEEEEDTNLDLNEIELEDQRMTDFINNFSEITTQIQDQIQSTSLKRLQSESKLSSPIFELRESSENDSEDNFAIIKEASDNYVKNLMIKMKFEKLHVKSDSYNTSPTKSMISD